MSYSPAILIPGSKGPFAPTISCDGAGCTVKYEVRGRGMGSVPPAWFLDGKAPPKWAGGRRTKSGIRVDLCPGCRVRIFDSRGKQHTNAT